MEDEIIDVCRGKMGQFRPVGAGCGAHEQAVFGADEQQVRVVRMLHQGVDRSGGEAPCQGRPGLAEVGGPENVRLEVPVTVSVESDVGDSRP